MKACALLVLLLSACAFGSDVTRGNHIDAIMRDSIPIYENNEVCARVGEVGQKVVAASGDQPGFPYSFYVLNSSDVTAFSAPGGHVYVTTGLLRHLESEDELAAVLGHEIAHINEHHLMKTEMSERTKKFWTIMLYVGSQAAAIYVGNLVGDAIGNSMSSTLITSNGQIIADPLNNTAQQIAGLAANAASIGTSAGGERLLNTFYKGFKDQYEFDADRLAMQYANKAGYDGATLVHVLERIGGTTAEINSTGVSHLHSPAKVLLERTAAAKKLTMQPAKKLQ